MATPSILSIDKLSLEFPIYKGAVKALNGVTLEVTPGEIVGVVGESGSGKSVTAMTAMRLLIDGGFEVTAGSITMLGEDIVHASEQTMLGLRGSQVAMIFQEPMTALNPTQRIGTQMVEVIRLHRKLGKAEARTEAARLLKEMHVADPEQILRHYPFELSGGMRQRVLIALAFSCEPRLLIADEPTTALDVTVQRQVLLLLREKARQLNTAVLFITHDMAVVSQFCDRVYVMYAGSVVESGPTGEVIAAPRHPYAQGLLKALPDLVPPRTPIEAIPGTVPDLTCLPAGCVFAGRCARVRPACRVVPELRPVGGSGRHQAACWAVQEEETQS
jgi:peptide/nickel transport system ATP-binding protein